MLPLSPVSFEAFGWSFLCIREDSKSLAEIVDPLSRIVGAVLVDVGAKAPSLVLLPVALIPVGLSKTRTKFQSFSFSIIFLKQSKEVFLLKTGKLHSIPNQFDIIYI